MNIAEIALEQVLAGITGLLICVLPFVRVVPAAAYADTPAVAVALLGTAYMLGATFDKLFDAAMAGPEAWKRLKIAERCHKETIENGQTDLFNQEWLEAKARRIEGAAQWMHYLRVRLRLARTMGIGVPLVSLSIASSLWMSSRNMPDIYQSLQMSSRDMPDIYQILRCPSSAIEWFIGALPIIVLAAVVGLSSLWEVKKTYQWKIPPDSGRDGRVFKLIDAVMGNREQDRERRKAFVPIVSMYLLAGVATWRIANPTLALLGTVIGFAAFWSWWKILESYMRYVAIFKKLDGCKILDEDRN